MKVQKRYLAAGAAAALIAGGALAATAGAATSSQVVYTTTTGAGGNAAAGWEAFSPNLVNFTHIESYIGSAGNSSLENLPVVSGLSGMPAGTQVTSTVTGGVGLALCDRTTGDAAQVGEVNVGGGKMDVVEALGLFGTATNSSGDKCDNGLLGQSGSQAALLRVLLTNVNVNDTVQAGVLYDTKSGYSYRGHSEGAGSVTFYATDLTNATNSNYDAFAVGRYVSGLTTVTEADAGVVADATKAPALTLSVPAPNGGVLSTKGDDELVRFAHVKVNANSRVTGGSEVEGAFQSSQAWNVYPVAATTDGTKNGEVYLDPSQFAADNFYVAGGLGLVG